MTVNDIPLISFFQRVLDPLIVMGTLYLSALLFMLKPQVTAMAAEKIAVFVGQHVRDWLGLTGEVAPEQLSVQLRPPDDDPSALLLAVTATPSGVQVPRGPVIAAVAIIPRIATSARRV